MSNTDNEKKTDGESTVVKPKESKTQDPASAKAPVKKEAPQIAEPAFLTKSPAQATKSSTKSQKIKWSLIIPALVIVLCMVLFSVASYAGWIQTFLTPDERRILRETTTETSSEPETTTKEIVTTTEATTEETTTEFVPSHYVIHVNLAYNWVTVYERGEKYSDGADPKDPLDDEYDLIPHIAFICSSGVDGSTPTGVFYLQNRAAWCAMIHDVYTQYATRIEDDVMFHSIPYFSDNPGDLATYDYNILGQDASSACIRLNVRDAYWIYNYCEEGTEVDIFYDWSWPGPIDPEPIYHIPEDWGELSKWDPTDIYSPGNPWNNYDVTLANYDVTVPLYSSVERLIAAFAPSDNYGNVLAGYFYTDGDYNLEWPGTYYTTGYVSIANKFFSFPISITVTEEIAEEYYNDGIWDDGWDEDTWEEDDYNGDEEYYEEEAGYAEGGGDEYSEEEPSYEEDGYEEENY